MAQVLISEPHADVRRLFERMVTRLGHDPVAVKALNDDIVAAADVLLVEPAEPAGASLARLVQRLRPSLPIVCVSIAPPTVELGLIPTAYLLKPFSLAELSAALDAALAGSPR